MAERNESWFDVQNDLGRNIKRNETTLPLPLNRWWILVQAKMRDRWKEGAKGDEEGGQRGEQGGVGVVFNCHFNWPLQDLITWHGINYAVTQWAMQWDFQNKRARPSPARLSFVLEVPTCNLRPGIIYSVPCDRILQRAYCPIVGLFFILSYMVTFKTDK